MRGGRFGKMLRAPGAVRRATGSAFLGVAERLKRALVKDRDHLFIAAMPKSGSSFLLTALMEATGYERAQLCYAYERLEPDLYLPLFIDRYGRATVSREHTRATGPNLDLLRRFDVRPVVLVRDLFDVVPSVRDHLLREGAEHFPSLISDISFEHLPPGEQLDAVVELVIPWYLGFYVSWYRAEQEGRVEPLWLRFDDIARDGAGTVRRVLDFYGIHRSDHEVEEAVARALGDGGRRARLNQGRSGRGREVLTDEQCARIVHMTRFYPSVDFSPVGIGGG